MILKQFTLGAIENNNYLLIDNQSDGEREAILIDCTEESEEIYRAIEENDAKLKYILLTHGHFDHVLGINKFKERFHCKAYIHQEDGIMLDTIKDFAAKYGVAEVEIQKVDGFLKDNDIIKFGKHEIKAIHTPGHTKGGTCYLLDDKIFTGDTLFYESVGRTDLPGGCFSEIKESIQNKLFTLDENIKVYPGHGPHTTIGHEKNNNTFV